MTARIYRSTSEAEIRACVEQGMTIKEIADELCVSPSMLRSAMSLLDITPGDTPQPVAQGNSVTWNDGWEQSARTKPTTAAYYFANPFGI